MDFILNFQHPLKKAFGIEEPRLVPTILCVSIFLNVYVILATPYKTYFMFYCSIINECEIEK